MFGHLLHGKRTVRFVKDRPGDAAGLLLEDPRQGLVGIVHRVVLAVAGGGNVGEVLALGRAVGVDRHRGNRHAHGPQPGDRRRPRRSGVAVAEHDHVLHGHLLALQPDETLFGQEHGRFEVGHVAGDHAIDGRQQLVAILADLHGALAVDPDLVAVPLHHAAIVLAAEGLDRFLGDLLLDAVALGDFAGVHQQHQRAAGGHFGIADLEIDRHGLFQFRAGPSAGAEALRPAQHDQPRAHLLRVAHEHVDLLVAEAHFIAGGAGHVGQHDGVEDLQFGEAGEEPVRAADDHFQAVLPQPLGQQVVLVGPLAG